MTYKEALHIGSKADGTIKGAFAEFFDESGKKCFSLQRRNFTQTETVKKDETLIVPVAPRTYEFINGELAKGVSGVGDATDLVIDLDAAVCRTYAPAKTGDKIPVAVTNDARQYIEEKILKKSKYYRIYATYTVYKNGEWLNPERRTELIWDETYKPSDALRKSMYDGTPYKFVASMPVSGPGTNQISAWLNGNLIGAPEGTNKDRLFNKSLWLIGIMTWANAQNIPNAQIRQWLLQFGYPQQMYFPDAWAWKTKYEASQEEALEMLIADQRTQPFLERVVDILGGEVYVDIQLEERYGIEDYSPEQKAIAEMLNKNATFYVNPAAFDWQNTDINNATIEVNNIEINLDAYIADCKKKYDRAKAILAAAGATSLL